MHKSPSDAYNEQNLHTGILLIPGMDNTKVVPQMYVQKLALETRWRLTIHDTQDFTFYVDVFVRLPRTWNIKLAL